MLNRILKILFAFHSIPGPKIVALVFYSMSSLTQKHSLKSHFLQYNFRVWSGEFLFKRTSFSGTYLPNANLGSLLISTPQ